MAPGRFGRQAVPDSHCFDLSGILVVSNSSSHESGKSMNHPHGETSSEQRLLRAMLLTGGFMVVEVVGGLISGSLALLADAGHMLTDTVALALGWLGARLARRPADQLRSYGYHRTQVLAALLNGIGFIALVAWICVEAWSRFQEPVEILGWPMLLVAVTGLVVNGLAFRMLHGGHHHDLNLKAAALHVIGDLLGSVAAIVAALVVLSTGWTPIDPLLSVLVAFLIAVNALRVVRQSVHILLEGSPQDVDVELIREQLVEAVPDVTDVHHVHVWSISPERPVLTMHVTVSTLENYSATLHRIQACLVEHFSIEHATVQIEIDHCTDDAADTQHDTAHLTGAATRFPAADQ
jgi:cobalt-zinc-cadmium efflux system protein